jgi:hypothetical protein
MSKFTLRADGYAPPMNHDGTYHSAQGDGAEADELVGAGAFSKY